MYVPNTEVDSHSLNVNWQIDCQDMKIVQRYELSYGPVKDFNEKMCVGPKCEWEPTTIMLNNTKLRSFNVTGLRPYTIYHMNLKMVSSKGNGAVGETWDRTKEAGMFISAVTMNQNMNWKFLFTAPSPPQSLNHSQIRNNSVHLSWKQPEELNGIIRRYKIHLYRESDTNWEVREVPTNATYFVLDNLNSFTNYTTEVYAQTVEWSAASSPSKFTTDIGGIVQHLTCSIVFLI